MAQRKTKKKGGRSARETARRPPAGALARELERIEDLVHHKKLVQAQRELTELCKSYPNREEPLALLAHVCQELDDQRELQHACERLLKFRPDHRDLTLLLAGSSLQCGRPAIGRRAILRFLAQWPDDPLAEQLCQQLADIERHIRSYLEGYGLPDQQMWELADEHEQILTLVSRSQHQRARELAERLLARQPDFVAGWNNLSLARFYLGDVAGAIAASQRALELEADNYQALSNLIRCLTLAGRREQALALVVSLKAAQSESVDLFVKTAEALAILSDDEGLLAVLDEAESHRRLKLHGDATLLHYPAVASLRLGDESRAESLWRRALQLDPALTLARENLDDLAEPPEERDGPWAFSMPNLCPHVWLERLRPPKHGRAGSGGVRGLLRRALEQSPQIIAAAPAAMEVGDPMTSDLFIALASDTELPELLEALKTFALGQRGAFAARSKASICLAARDSCRQGRSACGATASGVRSRCSPLKSPARRRRRTRRW